MVSLIYSPAINKPCLKTKRVNLTYQRYVFRGRHDLCNHQLEHSQSEKNRNAQRHFFPGVCREIESQWGQERDQNTRKQQIKYVERRFPFQNQCEGHIGIRFRAAAISDDVLNCWHTMNLPFHIFYEIREVTTIKRIDDVYLITIIGPGSKCKVALLAVKRKIRYIHYTWALCDSRCIPSDFSIISQHNISIHWFWKVIIRPKRQKSDSQDWQATT